ARFSEVAERTFNVIDAPDCRRQSGRVTAPADGHLSSHSQATGQSVPATVATTKEASKRLPPRDSDANSQKASYPRPASQIKQAARRGNSHPHGYIIGLLADAVNEGRRPGACCFDWSG